MRRDGVIVLGMHRSGTSAVTSALDAMGLHVGLPEELMATSWENPHGFFERRDLRRICDALLWGAGGEWWRVSGFSVEAIPASVRADTEAAIRTLGQHLDAHRPWAIKEPRLCLLLPVFEAVADRAAVVHPVRSPLEVARSLARRNGIPLCAGIALWEVYNRAAAAHARGWPRVMVDYARLVAAPADECRRIARELEAHGLEGLDPDAGPAAIHAELHRERAHSDGDFLGEPQRDLWRTLLEGDPDRVAPAPSEVVTSVLAGYEATVDAEREGQRLLLEGKSAKTTDTAADRSERERLEAELARERARLAAVYASRSWRLSRPLRSLGSLVRAGRCWRRR